MTLLLQEVGYADGVAIANIYISAFFEDPFQMTCFPGMSFDQQVAGVISRWPNNYGNISDVDKKVVDTESGETVGYSKWGFGFTDAGGVLKKPTDIPEDVEVKPPSTPEGLDHGFATEFTRKAVEIRTRILGERPQLILRMLVTHPSYQRRGVAALQLAWATELADRKGLTCWVESSVVAVPLYERFDFEVKDTILSQCRGVDGEKPYVSTCMMREPKIKG
ncbi:hypothetical protein VTL71DRAFT_7576 [Oculimacula yallundae]|uniref:N-acetyltransferase domain-containing protein n=1 Tax=Oculimacula yallundae TaxID=86028 RepID=A0ABR4BUH5_9HELO